MSLRDKARATAVSEPKTSVSANTADSEREKSPSDLHSEEAIHPVKTAHNREEIFLALFEIMKEMAFASDEASLFRGIATGVMAHLAVPGLALFVMQKGRFLVRHCRGYKLAEGSIFPAAKLPELLLKERGLHYTYRIKDQLSDEENLYLAAMGKSVIVPSIHQNELVAFAIVALPEKQEFTSGDLLFLQLFGETLAAFRSFTDRLLTFAEESRIFQQRELRQSFFNEFVYRLSLAASGKDADLLLSETLNEKFGLQMYVLLVKEDYFFRVYLAQGLRRTSVLRFEMPVNDSLAIELQQAQGWQMHENFRDDRRFRERLDDEDLSLAEGAEILPLFHNRQLQGMLVLFFVKKILSGDDRFYLQGILQTWLFHKMTQHLTLRREENLESPFQPIRTRINKAEEKLAVHGTPYMGAVLQIVNLDRLEGIYGPQYAADLRNRSVQIIRQHLKKEDFCLELLHGQFFILAEDIQSAQAFKLTRQIQHEISELHPREELAPLVRTKFFCRPESELPEPEKFLQV